MLLSVGCTLTYTFGAPFPSWKHQNWRTPILATNAGGDVHQPSFSITFDDHSQSFRVISHQFPSVTNSFSTHLLIIQSSFAIYAHSSVRHQGAVVCLLLHIVIPGSWHLNHRGSNGDHQSPWLMIAAYNGQGRFR